MNRAHLASDNFSPSAVICPYHRYTYGIHWRPSTMCQLPYHEHQAVKATRWFSYQLCQAVTKLERLRDNCFCFPIGQPVCRNCIEKFKDHDGREQRAVHASDTHEHRHEEPRAAKLFAENQIRELITADADSPSDATPSQTSTTSTASMFDDDIPISELNAILQSISSDIPIIKYQIRQSIDHLSSRTVHELKRQYETVLSATGDFVCEGMAPGQGKTLRSLFDSDDVDNDEEKLDEQVQSLLNVYQDAPSRKWKLLLLATLLRSMTRGRIRKIFSCSRYMVDKSRVLRRKNEQYNLTNPQVIHRCRTTKDRLEFFFRFLFTSGLVQDVAHGTAYMKFDTGRKAMIPHVVRTMIRTHVYQLYQQHCAQAFYPSPLSHNTVYRLLDICKMREKKTMCGLDSFVVDGMDGFDTLRKLVPKLTEDQQERHHLVRLLFLGQEYGKVEYKVHVMQDTDTCITHCRSFALSHATEKQFRTPCSHNHSFTCMQCNTLLALLCRLRQLAEQLGQSNERDEVVYDLEIAIADILELMFHVLRGVQQDESKRSALEMLDSKSGLLLSDWSMKINTQQHREKMDEWYGKRGISLHVDVLFYVENNRLKKATYFTAIDRCPQDMISVLAVCSHVLKQIRQDFPRMKSLYTRSDNAGCYSGAAVILGRQQLCTNLGFELKRTDFNEPQRGKDQADRDIAVAKSCIRAFVDRGGNLTNATAIKEALDSSFGSLAGSKTSVLAIDAEKSDLSKVKLKDITKYHSVAFTPRSVRFWQYYGIGERKEVKRQDLRFVARSAVVQPFSIAHESKDKLTTNPSSPGFVLFCSDPACSAVFDDEADLMDHEESNDHTYCDDAATSTKDRARQVFLEHLKGARLLEENESKTALASIANVQPKDVHSSCSNCTIRSTFCSPGYAIRKRKTLARITSTHNDFFGKLFAQEKGQKYTVDKAHEEMRCARKADGAKLFTTSEYLNKGQIRGLFGRLSKKLRARTASRTTSNRRTKRDHGLADSVDNAIEDEQSSKASDDDQAHYFELEQEQSMENLIRNEVQRAVEMQEALEDDLDVDSIRDE